MAQTKVKLISDGVIDVNHLASGHSITTDNIGEGSNLYYTDARVSTYLSTNNYATEGYVTTAVANLVDSAPTTLDTLNELAAALGDDPNFATTVTNSIATKLPLAGGTLTGALTTASPLTIQDASPYIQWKNTSGTRLGYIQHNETDLVMSADTGTIGLDANTEIFGNLNLQTSDDTRLTLSDTTDSSSITVRADLTNSIYSNKSLNIYTENADHISFSTNGQSSERVRIDSSGNVGIGETPSPISGEKLLTLKNTGNYASLFVKSTNVEGIFRSHEPNSTLYIGSTSNHPLSLITNGAEKVHITSAGNVGFGTGTPTARIDSTGGGYKLQGGWGLFSSYTSDGLFSSNSQANFLSTNGYNGTYSKFSGNGGLLLGYQDNGAGLYSPAYGFEVKSIDGRPVGGQVVKAIVMHDIDTDEKPFWVNNNGSAYFKNNVGIGTTSPAAKLEIYGTGNTLRLDSAANQSKTILLRNVGTATAEIKTDGNLDFNIEDAGRAMRFLNGNTERMRINSSGNVGIGTTSPSAKLHTNLALQGSLLSYLNGTSATFDGGANLLAVHNSPSIGSATAAGLVLANNDKSVNAISPIIAFSAKSSSNSYNHTYAAIYGVRTGSGADSNWTTGDLVFATSTTTGPYERVRVKGGTGTLVIPAAVPFNLTNTGSGTYNKTVIYNDPSNGLLIEGAIATDSYSGTKLPVTLTWRGGMGQGGLKLNGNTQLHTDDTGLGIDTSSPSAKLTVNANGTNEFAESIYGNNNAQGSAARHTIVRHFPVVSSGTRLEFPFISQGNLNCSTIVKVWGHGARWNTKYHTAFSATFAVGHLSTLGYLDLLESSGNIASLTSSGMTVYLNFNNAFTSGTADGVYVTIEYMTSVRSYSLDTANITMN